ncbi:triose-phosphate transporter family-domain-containing protein [Butyriboletus roseoflavus]|nr:triose-phosphate transporter family-domain-containing protein [Butyriboletus roseoflavus]
MHKNHPATDPVRYPPYDEYLHDNPANFGHAWQASNPSEAALSMSQGAWSNRLGHRSLFSFSSISENLKRIFYRRPFAREAHHFPSSFVRRTRGPWTSATEPPAASTARFLILCIFWYTTSALSSNTGKAILEQFRYPVTLTIIQFGFVASCCLLIMTPAINFSKLRSPTVAILRATLPMGAFQVGGHMFSSMAISRIHVSTVHTIKVSYTIFFPVFIVHMIPQALSPLFTVAAYALLFGVKYSPKTYLSLLPLTIGVMLASTFDTSASSPMGLLCAFGSALVFVSSNIFFKKVIPSGSQASSHRLDKVNLLFYSSSAAFALMVPLWSFTDLPRLLAALDNPTYVVHPHHDHSSMHSLSYHFIVNGLAHFAQNIIAFVILSSTSPVTYSIASLVKRIWVICMAILWFNQRIHPIQGAGIGLTFIGLYTYNSAKSDVEKGETKVRRVEATRDMMLPSNRTDEQLLSGSTPSSPSSWVKSGMSSTTGMKSRPQFPPLLPGGTRAPSPEMHKSSLERKLSTHVSPLSLSSAFTKRAGIISPTDLYPSPPPSLDSPLTETVSLTYPHPHLPGVECVHETQVSA